MTRSRPALYDAAASAVVDSGRPSGSRGRAIGWCPPTSRPSSSRLRQRARRRRAPRSPGQRLRRGSRAPPWTPTARRGAAPRASRSGPRWCRPSRPGGPTRCGSPCRAVVTVARAPPARRGEQVVEQRVAQLADVMARTRCSSPPSRRRAATPSDRVTRSPPRGSGSTSSTSAAATCSRPVDAQRVEQRHARRRHPVPQHVPRARPAQRGTAPGRPRRAGPTARPAGTAARRPPDASRRSPPCTSLQVPLGPLHDAVEVRGPSR